MSVLRPPVNRDIKFTYRDYALTPEDKRYELIEGELLMTPSPVTTHQRIVGNLFFCLKAFVERNSLGEVFVSPIDIYFSELNVCQPDVVFVSKERADIVKEKYIQGPPDLVVEVLSPSTADRDLVIKKTLYARFGVPEYWIVDPEQKTVQVLVLQKDGYREKGVFRPGTLVRSDVLPESSLDPAEVFGMEPRPS